jgi:hypothetical protein
MTARTIRITRTVIATEAISTTLGRIKRPEQYYKFDDGLYGHITWRNLAALAAERGDRMDARRSWEAVLVECPGDRKALERLGSIKSAPREKRESLP